MFQELTESISNRLEKDFHKEILLSSIEILKSPNITTKFSNFATNLRELTRELFHTLAPDEEVKNCEWYEKETSEGTSDITRVQRMIYAIKGGLSNEFIENELEIDFEKQIIKFKKVISILNKYTHINEKVYYREEKTGYEMVKNTLVALDHFLATIEHTRIMIISELETNIYDSVSSALSEDVINEIDILATHYWVEGVWVNDIDITHITSRYIDVDVTGSVDIHHQYGSDGDFRRGNGVRNESSYPLYLTIKLDIDDPLEVKINPDDITVDNSSFFE